VHNYVYRLYMVYRWFSVHILYALLLIVKLNRNINFIFDFVEMVDRL